jgi:hypothetical protein
MQLVEQVLGLAPDGGNGSLEFFLLAVLFLLTFLTITMRKGPQEGVLYFSGMDELANEKYRVGRTFLDRTRSSHLVGG